MWQTCLSVQVCGRKIVRRVVQLAGLPCFWDGQYQPPPSLLSRAKEYVGILASIMELPQPAGTIELLQGEPIALLLKSIGNALSKSEPAGAAPPQRQPLPQEAQQTGKQRKAAGKAGPAGTDSLLLSGVAAEKLQSLRALVVLMNLLGEHLGTHALQVGDLWNYLIGTVVHSVLQAAFDSSLPYRAQVNHGLFRNWQQDMSRLAPGSLGNGLAGTAFCCADDGGSVRGPVVLHQWAP
jgi:hypothetical protein